MAVKKGEIGIDLGTGVQAKVEAGMLIVKGPKGEVKRNVSHPRLDVEVTEGKVKVSSEGKSLSEKRLCCTYRAHVRNMVKGVKEGHEYLIKICSSHFPMNVSISNGQLVVKNFLGEKHPRKLELSKEVDVKVNGDTIVVTCPDKEMAGTVASRIEGLMRRPGFDPRIFQDGCYIMSKSGKELK
ncbi:50S ribosomal protein L6 [Candidatus Woesearchaeota archaeon]|nr:50S ribosomal protein L6 [Candidatus Woesearchaeota archaeon]